MMVAACLAATVVGYILGWINGMVVRWSSYRGCYSPVSSSGYTGTAQLRRAVAPVQMAYSTDQK